MGSYYNDSYYGCHVLYFIFYLWLFSIITIYNKIQNKILDILYDSIPCIELNLLRALVFKKKYSLNLSLTLRNKFVEYIGNNLLKIQEAHYHTKIFSSDDIEADLNKILLGY